MMGKISVHDEHEVTRRMFDSMDVGRAWKQSMLCWDMLGL